MKDYTWSKGKKAELEKIHRSLRDKRQADRVKAVIALSRGWSAAQVTEILLFDEKTSRHYFERYRSRLLKKHLDGTKIKLIFLPLYSPNLNLIERYWKFFKKKVLNNHYYETFEEFKRGKLSVV